PPGRSRTCGPTDRRPPVGRPCRRASAAGAGPRGGGPGARARDYTRLPKGLRAAGAGGTPRAPRGGGTGGGGAATPGATGGGGTAVAVVLPPGCSHVISPVEKIPLTLRSKSSGLVAA